LNNMSHHFYPMTVDPHDASGNTIYVSTFNCNTTGCRQGFVQSTDGGVHWTVIGNHLYNSAFVHNSVVHYSGSTRVIVAGTYLGVFYSTNDGASWNKLASNMPNSIVMWVALDK